MMAQNVSPAARRKIAGIFVVFQDFTTTLQVKTQVRMHRFFLNRSQGNEQMILCKQGGNHMAEEIKRINFNQVAADLGYVAEDGPGGPRSPGEGQKSTENPILNRFVEIRGSLDVLERILGGDIISDEVMLTAFGFRYQDLLAMQAENDPVIAPIPDKLVLLTFDDGTRDHIDEVPRILEKYHARANFCIAESEAGPGHSGFEDKNRYMTWEEIRRLSDMGHEIVNHSWHHSMKFAAGSEEEIKEEILGLERDCEVNGIPRPTTFAYPGGGCTSVTESIVMECGYNFARGDMTGMKISRDGENYYDPHLDSPYAIPSFNMVPAYGETQISAIIENAVSGRIAVFAYHQIDPSTFRDTTFEQQLACMAGCGARFITFRDLTDYIDPKKAYCFTHTGAVFL
mgnify:CR=1 FL=1